jgi:hypothetical protein
MTVSEAILNLGRALTALVPVFDKAGVPWKRPDAYDEWDAVASALFSALVTEVLRWQLPEHLQETFELTPYDLLLPTYRNTSTIEIANVDGVHDRCVFHALATRMAPFDTVEYRRVSAAGDPLSDTLESVPLGRVSLRLRVLDPRSTEVLVLD